MTFACDTTTGLVSGAQFIPSPNFDERPPGTDIDLLVLHGISLPPNEFGNGCVARLFTNCLPWEAHPYFQQIEGLKVSSHLFITRQGELQQFVPLHLRAWHAGQSSFAGRTVCNDFSIGIELEGADDIPYTLAQYRCLQVLLPVLITAYPLINGERIVGHSDISPGRKTDPGPAFDWRWLKPWVTRATGGCP